MNDERDRKRMFAESTRSGTRFAYLYERAAGAGDLEEDAVRDGDLLRLLQQRVRPVDVEALPLVVRLHDDVQIERVAVDELGKLGERL